MAGSFNRLAWTDDKGVVTILDAARASVLAVLHPAHDNYGVNLALSDDGELLAVVGESLTIHRASTGVGPAVSRDLHLARFTETG
ncbi:MAG: hypothetical protein ACMG6S_15395 [Byssovorax sp.]